MVLLPRALRRAFGEGALAGLAAGTVLGLWHVRLGGDLDHGLRWLAAERILQPAAQVAGLGVAFSLALAGLAVVLRILLPRLRQAGAVAVAGLAVMGTAALLIFQTNVFPMAAERGSPRLTLAAVTACLVLGLLLVGARLVDLLLDADETLPRFRWRGLRLAATGSVLLAITWSLALAWPYLGSYRAAARPSVIIVSLDTMRADRLGVLSRQPSLTPYLDELAGEGLVFSEAHATAPWTLPSHTSIFTSLMPFDHHVRWSWMRIPQDQVMLAEHFRDAGYRTAAFTGGGYVAGHFGFRQGFTLYQDHDEIAEHGPEAIAAAALDWTRDTAHAPYFMFVHTYEPHSPFQRGAAISGSDPGRLTSDVSFAEVEKIHNGDLVLTAGEREHVINLYDADIAHTDRVMGGLLKQLRDEGLLDNTILVVLSDHGEDLWDHSDIRSPGHGHSLYQELIRVPLFVRAPGRVPSGSRLSTPVSLLDVAPTLLAMAGFKPDLRHQGRSLETALLTATEPEPMAVLAESVEYGPDRFMRREGNMKVVFTPTPGKQHHDLNLRVVPLEIFDLTLDPLELNSVAMDKLILAARPLVLATRARAQDKLQGDALSAEEKPDLPPELEEQLRSLGYIQ